MNDQIPRNPHPVKPPADLPPPRKESLQDEVKRLKSEVERLGSFRTHTIIPNEILMAENARLKAELDEIVDDNIRLTQDNGGLRGERDRLKADNERLRKAGDELADKAKLAGCNECFGMFNALEDALDAWNAAKEGKGQP